MRGFTIFMRKEAREIVRTWRIWVLPGIVLLFAISGPLLAKVTPELLKSVAGSQSGVTILIPKPTYHDSYLQWAKNLAQMVTFAIIVIYGGIVSGEERSGTAALVLSKPLSRTSFIAAKYVVQALFLTVTVTVGALITWGVTVAVFGASPVGLLARSTAVWLVWALLLLAMMVLFSVLTGSQAGSAGLGFGVYIVVSLGALWGPLARYSPSALVDAPSSIAAGGGGELAWPMVTSAALSVLALWCAVLVFGRKEL